MVLRRAINEKFPSGLPIGTDIKQIGEYAYFIINNIEYSVSLNDGYISEKRLIEEAKPIEVPVIVEIPEPIKIEEKQVIEEKTTIELVDEIDSIIESATVSNKKPKKSI